MGKTLNMFWKAIRITLVSLSVVLAVVLGVAALMSDKLTRREAVERIMAADEPCRAAFAKVLNMYETDMEGATRASTEGEPICRSSFETLDRISIYVPKDDYDDERLKRDTIKACAQLSRVRADLLAQFGSETPDESKMAALNKELAHSDALCQRRFEQLAKR